ncbi:MAG: hypothetical protein HQ567_05810 [Candidatus Nealsonbacteria bacterium]|nr:hypothetical protein [Candidatus Nealsonbacteria bacterium]
MSDTFDDDLKRFEEQKREANCDPAERWRVLQETITWAEAQATVRRNTRERCLELQAEKLKEMS